MSYLSEDSVPLASSPCKLGTLGRPANWSTGSADTCLLLAALPLLACPTRLYPPRALPLLLFAGEGRVETGVSCASALSALVAGAVFGVLLSGGHDAFELEGRRWCAVRVYAQAVVVVAVIVAAVVWLVVARWAARESLVENIAHTMPSDSAMGGIRRGGRGIVGVTDRAMLGQEAVQAAPEV